MSAIGRPPGKLTFSPTPPERGSFPLDHDGECKPVMTEYLACLKRVRGTNDPECRLLAKAYLKCRMDRNLMAVDEFKNLGFAEEAQKSSSSKVEQEEKRISKLDELRRENDELKKKHGKSS